MRGRYLTVSMLVLVWGSHLWSQRIERSAITPIAGSTVIGTTAITWTAGDIATGHRRVGNAQQQQLTEGFQQPYYSLAYLRVEDFSGMPGETRQARILLDHYDALFSTTLDRVRLSVRFNATLLAPVGTIPGIVIEADTIANGMRTLTFTAPVPATVSFPTTLASIPLAIGLGNNASTSVELLNLQAAERGVILHALPGTFTLLGVCQQGGPRLVDPVQRTRILFRPNPVTSVGEVEFDNEMACNVRIVVVDMLGRPEQTIADEELAPGHFRVTFDASHLPAGAHTIVLQTPTAITSRSIIVQR